MAATATASLATPVTALLAPGLDASLAAPVATLVSAALGASLAAPVPALASAGLAASLATPMAALVPHVPDMFTSPIVAELAATPAITPGASEICRPMPAVVATALSRGGMLLTAPGVALFGSHITPVPLAAPLSFAFAVAVMGQHDPDRQQPTQCRHSNDPACTSSHPVPPFVCRFFENRVRDAEALSSERANREKEENGAKRLCSLSVRAAQIPYTAQKCAPSRSQTPPLIYPLILDEISTSLLKSHHVCAAFQEPNHPLRWRHGVREKISRSASLPEWVVRPLNPALLPRRTRNPSRSNNHAGLRTRGEEWERRV